MKTFTNKKILRIWELAQRRHPLDQGVVILREFFPERSWQELANLTIGQRNDLLLTVRQQIFGERMKGVARCPACQEELEFLADVEEFRSVSPNPLDNPEVDWKWEKYQIRFRLLNSLDLAAVASYTDLEFVRIQLAKRIILQITQEKKEKLVKDLPEEGLAALSRKARECDPQAYLEMDLECPECCHKFSMPLDIIRFLWKEIEAKAHRLLWEVRTLAQFYGWSESHILAMSATRRYYYLEIAEE